LRVETVRAKAKKAKPARERKTGVSRTTPRLRIVMGEGLILGPGKVDLIEAIERKGSISGASREMGMSYRRAWLLVDALNTMFGRPIVTAAPGGSKGGGAEVTELGRAIAKAYRRIEQRTRTAIQEELAPFYPELESK